MPSASVRALGCVLREGPGIKHPIYPSDHILPPVQFIGHRRTTKVGSRIHVPQGIAVLWIKSKQVPAHISGKQQLPCSGEDAWVPLPFFLFSRPPDLARLIIDADQPCSRPQGSCGTSLMSLCFLSCVEREVI